MLVSLSQAPWPWSLEQRPLPLNAAPGSALSGAQAEDPNPPAEGAADAPAIGATARPADLPAPQRVTRTAETQSQYTRRGASNPEQTQPAGAAGQDQASRQGVDFYV